MPFRELLLEVGLAFLAEAGRRMWMSSEEEGMSEAAVGGRVREAEREAWAEEEELLGECLSSSRVSILTCKLEKLS